MGDLEEIAVTGARRPAAASSTDYVAEYKIPSRVSLLADREPRLYPIAEDGFDVDLVARVVPAPSRAAHLEAVFKYQEQLPIEAGQLQLYRDGDYVGAADIPAFLPGVPGDANQIFLLPGRQPIRLVLRHRPRGRRTPPVFLGFSRGVQPGPGAYSTHLFLRLRPVAGQSSATRCRPRASSRTHLHEYIPICHAHGSTARPNNRQLSMRASPESCHACFPEFSQRDFLPAEAIHRVAPLACRHVRSCPADSYWSDTSTGEFHAAESATKNMAGCCDQSSAGAPALPEGPCSGHSHGRFGFFGRSMNTRAWTFCCRPCSFWRRQRRRCPPAPHVILPFRTANSRCRGLGFLTLKQIRSSLSPARLKQADIGNSFTHP